MKKIITAQIKKNHLIYQSQNFIQPILDNV